MAPRANPWKVPYIDLRRQYETLRREIDASVREVLSDAAFILRDAVAEFETRIAEHLGVGHVIGVNSGTDALFLALKGLDLEDGDEVVTVAHTFVATLGAIVHNGARPVLVDIGDDFNIAPERIEAVLTPRTRVLLPVHLNGRICDMAAIRDLARKHGLAIVEDAAQALGARLDGEQAGSFGTAGCFSLHPMKVLGVAGDGGFIATDDAHLAERLRMLRNIGQRTKVDIEGFGFNSRLDTLQAAIALVKLPRLPQWLDQRRRLAGRYHRALAETGGIGLPPAPEDGGRYDIFSSYVIRAEDRDALAAHLRAKGVEVMVHWPSPLHRNPTLGLGDVSLPETERASESVLSLPIFPEMTDKEQDYVIACIRGFGTE